MELICTNGKVDYGSKFTRLSWTLPTIYPAHHEPNGFALVNGKQLLCWADLFLSVSPLFRIVYKGLRSGMWYIRNILEMFAFWRPPGSLGIHEKRRRIDPDWLSILSRFIWKVFLFKSYSFFFRFVSFFFSISVEKLSITTLMSLNWEIMDQTISRWEHKNVLRMLLTIKCGHFDFKSENRVRFIVRTKSKAFV